MSLRESQFAADIKELLQCLDSSSILALSVTASNNRIIVKDTKEAIEVILRYTENLGKFFSYRKITSQVLFDYLHQKKVPVRAAGSKAELIEAVKKEWENSLARKQSKAVVVRKTQASKDVNKVQKTPTPKIQKTPTPKIQKTPIPKVQKTPTPKVQKTPSPSRQPNPTEISFNLKIPTASNTTTMNMNLTSPAVNVNVEVSHDSGGNSVRSDVFVQEFCNWFYVMMNRLQPKGMGLAGDTFSPDVFMANCYLDVYVYGSLTSEKHASGKQDVYLLMKNVCTDYKLCFVPCLDSGVLAEMSQHGLLKLFCCGTLHQEDSMMGVFEQEFSLVRCPQGKWKIMMTKINLKYAQSRASLPVLPKGPVFAIDC